MPSIGKEKQVLNFVQYRVDRQLDFWPGFVEAWDEKSSGKRFRSEVLSMTELWNLYLGYVRDAEQDPETGRARAKTKAVPRPKKGYAVVPIFASELPGRFNEKFRDSDDHLLHEGSNGYLHFDQWLYARDQARKDLFWFGKEVFDMDFYEHVHRVTCNQFVQKDFDDVFKEGYDRNDLKEAFKRQNRVPKVWVPSKDYEARTLEDFGNYIPDPSHIELKTNLSATMILLDPRGFFKTFTNILDTVQWIISCPDVRILIMSGTYKLTLQFLSLAKGKFFLPPGQKPTKFHLLFPEYVDRSADGDSKEPYQYLGRKLDSPDPTLGIMSIGSSLSGFHCDVLKFDDIVTDENCNTEETRQALLDKADGAVNLLMPWGWHDIIGTRYFPDDYYGIALDKFKESPEDYNLKFFSRAAWIVKDEFKEVEQRSLYDLTEEMVVLTFPEHKNFRSLRKDLQKNEKSFRCQQLNQPVWGDNNSVKFDRILLEAAKFKDNSGRNPITLQEVLAAPGYVYGAIDLARENKQFSDYTALAIGKVYQEGMNPFITPDMIASGNLPDNPEEKWVLTIIEVQFGKWSQTEIANRISAMHDRWRPKAWYGEDTGGLQLLKEKIIDVSKTMYGHWPYIRWDVPSNSESAKRNRIKGLETLLKARRLFFLQGNWWELGKIFDELEKYKGQKSTRYLKDDVPDVLAQLTRFIPSLVSLSKKEVEQQAEQKGLEYREYLRREYRRLVFGENSGGFGLDQSQFYSYGMELPEQDGQTSPMTEISKKFFGGNGLRA